MNMEVPAKLSGYFLPIVFLIVGCSQPGPSISAKQQTLLLETEVIVSDDTFDYHLERERDFSDSYMVFGASDDSRSDLRHKIWISGIKLEDAMSIYERYPDFHKCKSPGAAEAQNKTLSLRIIPASPEVLDTLKIAVSQFERNLKNDGDRIFVELGGELLILNSAIWREHDWEAIDQLPSQIRGAYYLVESAEIREAQVVLEN